MFVDAGSDERHDGHLVVPHSSATIASQQASQPSRVHNLKQNIFPGQYHISSRSSSRPSLDSTYPAFSERSLDSDERQHGRSLSPRELSHLSSKPPAPLRGWKRSLQNFWIRNKGVALVLLSQVFGSGMNVAARILETEGSHGKAMHPFQVRRFPFCTLGDTNLAIDSIRPHVPHYPLFPPLRLHEKHSILSIRSS